MPGRIWGRGFHIRIHDFINSKGNEVVVLDYSPLVHRLLEEEMLAKGQSYGLYSDQEAQNAIARTKESRRARITLYSRTSFSLTEPTTYIITSDSILYRTIRLSNKITVGNS
jgi:hypothetical protein